MGEEEEIGDLRCLSCYEIYFVAGGGSLRVVVKDSPRSKSEE